MNDTIQRLPDRVEAARQLLRLEHGPFSPEQEKRLLRILLSGSEEQALNSLERISKTFALLENHLRKGRGGPAH